MTRRLTSPLAALVGIALAATPAWAHPGSAPHLHDWAAAVILALVGGLAALRLLGRDRNRAG